MIAVHDPEIAERLRRLRAHGMDISDLARHSAGDVVVEAYPERGWNYRMTDMQAALGLCQLEVLDEILERRRRARRALHRRARPRSRHLEAALRPAVRGAHLAVLLRAGRTRRRRSVGPS